MIGVLQNLNEMPVLLPHCVISKVCLVDIRRWYEIEKLNYTELHKIIFKASLSNASSKSYFSLLEHFLRPQLPVFSFLGFFLIQDYPTQTNILKFENACS